MNNPIPTVEAVDAAAERYWYSMQKPSIGNDNGLNLIPWEYATPGQRRTIRDIVLPLLLAAYPQIIADILNHYAAELEDTHSAHLYQYGDAIDHLREQAAQVQPWMR